MTEQRIALLHPGAMGATVGASLRAGGYPVGWLARGRSDATRQRAADADLEPFDDLPALLDDAQAVISVCPPAAALEVAAEVAGTGFAGLYVDANAVAPDTARRLADLLGDGFVDGGIIGPPARQPGTTRLYLCGAAAARVADWFAAGPLDARAIAGPPGAASALKMCYAAYTKGSTALLLAIRALAEAEGVAGPLLEEWAVSQPGLADRTANGARGSAGKAWRFVGEMQEIADSFAAAGLPDGFHRAAADIYQRLAPFKDGVVDLDDVLARLRSEQ